MLPFYAMYNEAEELFKNAKYNEAAKIFFKLAELTNKKEDKKNTSKKLRIHTRK